METTSELFSDQGVPLAERMRPRNLQEFVGQEHLLAPGRVLQRAISRGRLPNMVLWGPPGVGKTTLARLLAQAVRANFVPLSATQAGTRQIREAISEARSRFARDQKPTVLFIDEIHRFHKGQQDTLLPHVEAGHCILIGATTENPSFEVNAALLSRVRVFQLRPLTATELVQTMKNALTDSLRGLGAKSLEIDDRLLHALAQACSGDARRALGALELAADLLPEHEHSLTPEIIREALGDRRFRYDKTGEEHYNIISALIKSMRASDADAAVYWLTRMLEAGEDIHFIARRLLIFASEDIGNADPQAIVIAHATAQAAHHVGYPEAVLPLTQAVIYLALAGKSNTVLRAYAAARKDVRQWGSLEVPLSVRNAVTALMKHFGYGEGYKYPHNFSQHIDAEHESYLPPQLQSHRYVEPGEFGWEAQAMERLSKVRNSTSDK